MGIWDSVSRTTDTLKRNAPDLTAVKNWCPTTESVKRIAPDVTAAKTLCSTSYGYGSTAVCQIDHAVRVNFNHYLREEEGRAKVVQLVTNIAKHSARESLQVLPGYKVVDKSIRDLNESDKKKVDLKALQAEICGLKKEFSEYREGNEPEVDVMALRADLLRLEKEVKELREYRKLCEQVQIAKPSADLKSPNTATIHSVANQKPEDVIRVFMMKEFCRQFLDDLVVPRGGPRKN